MRGRPRPGPSWPGLGAVAVAVLAFAGTPAVASAALPMKPCSGEADVVTCGELRVPLDPTAGDAGEIGLRVARVPAGASGRPPLLALIGGPGQAGIPYVSQLAHLFQPDLRGRDLIVFDQRGTGSSGAIDCPSLERTLVPSDADSEVVDCAHSLGTSASHFTTAETVADMEALRVALEIDRWAIYGVSYGTKVALAYAAAHPDRVERLILDSVVGPAGPDPLMRSTFAAVPRVLGDLCDDRCGAITDDPAADLAALVQRVRSGGVSGRVYSRDGRPRARSLTTKTLHELLLYGDFDPALRAAFPAAVRAAAGGDPDPVLRLAERIGPPPEFEPDPATFSYGLWAATVCDELTFPWAPETAPGARQAEARALVAELGDQAFAPFDGETALGSDAVQVCEHWPFPSRRSIVPLDRMRDIPALIVSGRDDIRTPLEDAHRLAAELADAVVLPVRGAGHSTLGGDATGCALEATAGFLDGAAVPRECSADPRLPALRPLAPVRLADVAPLRRTSGRRGRTLRALELTLRDLMEELRVVGRRQGGLRGGRTFGTRRGLRLERLSYVPGVKLSGLLSWRTSGGSLRIGGRSAARGRVRLGEEGLVTGVLGSRRVRARIDLGQPTSGVASRRRGLEPGGPGRRP